MLGGAVRPKRLAFAEPVAHAVAYGLAVGKSDAYGVAYRVAYGVSLTLWHRGRGCRRDRGVRE